MPEESALVWTFLLVLGVLGGLALLRLPFALRFWAAARRLGYLYVILILILAVLSLALHQRL